MKRASTLFKWRHHAPDVIPLCVRWCCARMMREGRVRRFDGRDAAGRAKLVESLFGVAA